MNQFKELGVRAGPAQLLNDTETDAAAAVHGHARRFVQCQKSLVFVNDREIPLRNRQRRFLGRALGEPDRRNAQHVPGLHPVVRGNPPLVAPHLPGSDDPVDVGLGNSLELAEQVIVQPLTG